MSELRRPEDDGLLGLHQALRRADFVVGPRELLAATQLLVRLHEAGLRYDEPARLRTLLSAVYCKSKVEQERFAEVFTGWLDQRAERGEQAPDDDSSGEAPSPETVPQPDSGRWRQRVLVGALTLVVLAGVAWRVLTPLQKPPPVDIAAPALPLPPAGADAAVTAGPRDPRTPEPGTADGNAGYEPQQLLQREFRPWLVALLLALPAPLLLLYAPALALSRRHLERQRQGAGVQLDVSSWRSEAERVVPAMNLQTAARMDRHVRQRWDDSRGMRRVLDPVRTLAATLRRHGELTLRWRARRTRPSYLVLIDVRDENDLRGRLFFRWTDRLRREGVSVEIWLFDGDPRVLYPAHQRRIRDAEGAERNAIRFEQVARRTMTDSVRRLILVGDGGGLFASEAQLQPWWPTLGWERWPERVMFTPIDSRDWGEREVAIERPLGRGDPGFLVLPLEGEALDAYAVQLTSGELPPIVLSAARRFPPLIQRLAQGGLAPEAPPDADVEKLVAQVRLYLGENGLRWLAACAVPPLTRWELTLLIGQELFRTMGATDEESLRWLMQTNYARLARLPWLRNASFPDWLALRLLDELSPPVQQRIRDIVRTLLDQVPPEQAEGARDVLTLDCTPPGAGAAGPQAAPGAPLDEAKRRRQWLYLGFLDGLTPRQLAMRAPLAWRQWFAAPRGPARGTGELLRFAFDWLRALVARLMWRDGRPESGSSLRPLVLSIAWVLGGVALLQWLAAQPEGTLAPRWADAVFAQRRSDAGAVSEVPYRQLAFSGDGTRFVAVDASGEIQVRRSDALATLVAAPIQAGAPLVAVFLDGKGEQLITVERSGRVQRRVLSTGHLSLGLMLAPHAAVGTGRDWAANLRDQIAGVTQHDASSGEPLIGAVLSADARQLVGWTAGAGLRLANLDTGNTAFSENGDGAVLDAVFRGDRHGDLIVLRGTRLERYDTRNDTLVFANPFRTNDKANSGGPIATLPRGRSWIGHGTTMAVTETAQGLDEVTLSLGQGPRALDFPDTKPVSQVAIANGRIAAARGSAVRAWDAGGRVIGSFTARVGEVRRLELVGDGSVLLVGDESDTVVAYKLPGPADAALPANTPPQDDAPPVALAAGLVLGSPLQALAVSPAGDQVLTASSANELRLWQSARLHDEPPPQVLPASAQLAVAITPDGRWAASGGADGAVQVWDVRSGALRRRIATGAGAVAAVVLAADGTRVVTLGADGRWRTWDASTGRPIGATVGEGLGADRVAVDRAGSLLLGRTATGVQLWHADPQGVRGGVQVQTSDVVASALSDDGALFLTARADGQVRVWSSSSGQRVADIGALGNAAAAQGTQQSAVAPARSAAATLQVPDVRGQSRARAMNELGALGLALRVVADGTLTRALPGTVLQQSPTPGSPVSHGSVVQLVVAGSACRSGFSERAAFAGDDACVSAETRDQAQRDNAAAASRVDPKDRRYGPQTCVAGFVWREADRPQRGEKFLDKVCVTPGQRQQSADDNAQQGKRMADGFGFHASIEVQQLTGFARQQANPVAALVAREALLGASFARNAAGERLVLARGATRARVFDLKSARLLAPPVTHVGLTALACWEAQDLLLTGGSDGLVRFWNIGSGQESLPALRHGAPIARMQVAPDGQHLATLDTGGTLRVWNLAARRALPTAMGPAVASFAFDAQGARLVAAVGDAKPRVVRLPSFTLGELRAVRPYAIFWLAVLALIGLGGVTGLVVAARRRSARLEATIHTPRSEDAGAVPA